MGYVLLALLSYAPSLSNATLSCRTIPSCRMCVQHARMRLGVLMSSRKTFPAFSFVLMRQEHADASSYIRLLVGPLALLFQVWNLNRSAVDGRRELGELEVVSAAAVACLAVRTLALWRFSHPGACLWQYLGRTRAVLAALLYHCCLSSASLHICPCACLAAPGWFSGKAQRLGN